MNFIACLQYLLSPSVYIRKVLPSCLSLDSEAERSNFFKMGIESRSLKQLSDAKLTELRPVRIF